MLVKHNDVVAFHGMSICQQSTYRDQCTPIITSFGKVDRSGSTTTHGEQPWVQVCGSYSNSAGSSMMMRGNSRGGPHMPGIEVVA